MKKAEQNNSNVEHSSRFTHCSTQVINVIIMEKMINHRKTRFTMYLYIYYNDREKKER